MKNRRRSVAIIALLFAALLLCGAYVLYRRCERLHIPKLNSFLSRFDSGLSRAVPPRCGTGYDCLNSSERQLYNQLLDAAVNHRETVYVKEPLSRASVSAAFTHLSLDYPSIYWLYWYSAEGTDERVSKVRLKYSASLVERLELQPKIDAAIADITAQASIFKSEYDRALYVHDLLIKTTVYDDSMGAARDSIAGPLVYGRATCSGYAAAYSLLLNSMGIECHIVQGYIDGAETAHAWNIARLDGVYALIDTTFDDQADSGGERLSHAYFAVALSRKSKNERYVYPEISDCGYFAKKGLVLDRETDLDRLSEALCANIRRGDHTIEFKLSSRELFDRLDEEGVRRLVGELLHSNKQAFADAGFDPSESYYVCERNPQLLTVSITFLAQPSG